MLLSESLVRVRRILRDSEGRVLSDTSLIKLWNEVQMELAGQTGMLEKVSDLSVPSIAQYTYTHKWELDHTAKPAALLYNHMSWYVYTQPWEVNIITGTASTVSGGYSTTQMWENVYVSGQNRVFHYFPDDFIKELYTAYDNQPVEWIYRTEVDNGQTTFKTVAGLDPYIYVEDTASRLFYLYPRVTATYGVTDMSNEFGELVYDSSTASDSLNPASNYGTIVFGGTAELDSDYGIVVRVQTGSDAIHLIYQRTPQSVVSASDTIDWPRWCVKYIEAGVLNRALSMETDLADATLAKFFQSRWQIGLKIIETYKAKRHTMRTFRFADIAGSGRSRMKKLADLPSHYPSLWR